MTIDMIVDLFAMERHPSAGWYSLHYSDNEILGRPKLSSIYFLISGKEPLPFHKLDAIEVWHHHLGAPAQIEVSNGVGPREINILGPDLAAGQRPQLAIPAFFWQSIHSLGPWSLLGCTMSPGYSPQTSVVLNSDT